MNGEGQAKTIWLVIVVILWIATGGTAFYLQQQWSEEYQRAETANTEKNNAQTEMNQARENYKNLQELVGVPVDVTHDNVKTQINGMLNKPNISTTRKEVTQTYPNLMGAVRFLESQLQQADNEIANLQQDKEKLAANLESLQNNYESQRNVLDTAKQQLAVEMQKREATHNEQLREKDEQVASFQKRYAEENTRALQYERDLTNLQKDSGKQIKDLASRIEQIQADQRRGEQVLYEHEDGRIIDVSPSGKEAVVNIGISDGLRLGTSFGIYGADETGSPYKLPKASLEIVRLLDEHRAEGRIFNSTLTDPIIPQDRIYNPIWSPGIKESVAFVGFIYMDDDFTPDNDKFRKLVTENGGQIDAEFLLDARAIRGSIDVKTGWLVVGDLPEPEAGDGKDVERIQLLQDMQKAASDLRGQASRNGVRIINYRNFLTYMGNNLRLQNMKRGEEAAFLRANNVEGRPRLIDQEPQKYSEEKK